MLIPMLHNHRRQAHAVILKQLADIVDAGALKPLLDESRYSFDAVGQAYARLESGDAICKVVVEF